MFNACKILAISFSLQYFVIGMKCIIFCKFFPYIFINYVVRLSGNSRLNTFAFYYLAQFFSPKVLSSPVAVIKLLQFDRSVLWLVTLGG